MASTQKDEEVIGKWKGKQLPNNLLDIGRVTENEIMYLLKARYSNDMIYTLMGDVQVAINPFKPIPVNVESYIKQDLDRLQPHAFQIAKIAYNNLQKAEKNQSVIISGESGAGKTETTKLILKYLTNGTGQEISEKLMNSNPILEAFGNAKTLRNNNSSRFGKWMTVLFEGNNNYKLCGANIVNYLLEKARISYQAPNERNYHIFYFMCKSNKNSSNLMNRFKLKQCDEFNYLNGGHCVDVETINDQKEFDILLNAFKIFDFSDNEINDILSILSGILHAGNITYKSSGEFAKIKDKECMNISAEFLGLNVKEFEKNITTKTIEIRKQETSTPLDINGCTNARDSICKDIYDKLFDFLVMKINDVLSKKHETDKKLPMIGVLDIFGFEIFKTNQFEQFCINFCNEKLQNHFQKYCWDREMKVYEKEGIDLSNIKFINNDKTIQLIEHKQTGIIRLIQDEVTMPKGNDESLSMRLHQQHSSHPNYKKVRKNTMQFTIIHFAGKVTYEINGFFEKNLSSLTQCTQKMIEKSKLRLIKNLYNKDINKSKKKSTKCVGTTFLKSLQRLIKSINSTKPHFIRCIKPNHDKKPGIWERDLIQQQLKFGGVFAYLQLRRTGYDVQIPFKQFVSEIIYSLRNDKDRKIIYDLIDNKKWLKGAKKLKPMLIKYYDLETKDIQFGKTKVFMQNKNYRKIEFAATFWIISFQKKWRKAHQINEQKRKELELKRKKEEEERKIEQERLKRQKEIESELNKIKLKGDEEKDKLSNKLKQEMNILQKEFEEKEIEIMANINMIQTQKESEYETRKDDMRQDMMMDLNDKTLKAKYSANTKNIEKNEKEREKLMLEIKALNSKQQSLKEILMKKITKIKNVKVEIKKLKAMSAMNNNDKNNVLNHKLGHVADDIWCIGSIGEITEKGGCSFYVSLNDQRFGFKTMLYFGDKILLISKKGYKNRINEDILSAKIMIIKSKSGKYDKEIGYVQITATSYFTKRTFSH